MSRKCSLKISLVFTLVSLPVLVSCNETHPAPASEENEYAGMDEVSEAILRFVLAEKQNLDVPVDETPRLDDCRHARLFPQHSTGLKSVDDSEAASIASNCPGVRLLHIPHGSLTDVGLMKLADLQNLDVLILGESGVTQDGLQQFRQLRPQCAIRIFPKKLSYELGSQVELEDFDAAIGVRILVSSEAETSEPVVDSDVLAISGFQELQCFTVIPDKIPPRPNPENFQLTDQALKSLSELPQLKAIIIWPAPRITGKGLQYLYGHPKLIYLGIGGSAITEEEFEKFQTAMPHCRLQRGFGV